jgi:hypothetical protein
MSERCSATAPLTDRPCTLPAGHAGQHSVDAPASTITGIIMLDPQSIIDLIAAHAAEEILNCPFCEPGERLCAEHLATLGALFGTCDEPGCWTCRPTSS